MKAKAYLSEVRAEYMKIREIRERLRLERNEHKQKDLRRILKTASAYYAGVLNEIWNTIDRMEPGPEQDIILRRYVFLEKPDEIADGLGCSVATVYTHHAKGIAAVQRILNGISHPGTVLG